MPTQIAGITTGKHWVAISSPCLSNTRQMDRLLGSLVLDRTSNYASTPHQTNPPHALHSAQCGSESVRGNKASFLACNLSTRWTRSASHPFCCVVGSGSRVCGPSNSSLKRATHRGCVGLWKQKPWCGFNQGQAW